MICRSLWCGLGLSAVLLAACDAGDDTVAPSTTKDAGGGGGGDATVDGAADVTVDTATDPNSLCAKYGGYTAVGTLVQSVVGALEADCKIGAFFTTLEAGDKTHLQECMTKQFGEWMGCGGVTYAGSNDSAGNPCRNMNDAHQNVDPQIRQADLDAFVIDVTGALKAAGMNNADLGEVLKKINTVSGDTVQSADLGLSNSTCDAGPVDSGIGDAPGEGG